MIVDFYRYEREGMGSLVCTLEERDGSVVQTGGDPDEGAVLLHTPLFRGLCEVVMPDRPREFLEACLRNYTGSRLRAQRRPVG